MALDRIKNMLATCSVHKDKQIFPPTTLYNEGWMLRLVLDWFSRTKHLDHKHKLSIPDNGRWYSEALLKPPFLARKLEDDIAEKYTHADGVIGQFRIGESGEGDLRLLKDSKHFVVIEAKMFSPLSKGTKNAPNYHQAARTIACMANTLSFDPPKDASEFEHIGFYVLVPNVIKDDRLKKMLEQMKIMEIRNIIKARVDEYKTDAKEYLNKCTWFDDYLEPMVKKMENQSTIEVLFWEDIINYIEKYDTTAAFEIEQFYNECKRYNRR